MFVLAQPAKGATDLPQYAAKTAAGWTTTILLSHAHRFQDEQEAKKINHDHYRRKGFTVTPVSR